MTNPANAVARLRHYLAVRVTRPIAGMGTDVHSVHVGTPHHASVTVGTLSMVLAEVDRLRAQVVSLGAAAAAVAWSEEGSKAAVTGDTSHRWDAWPEMDALLAELDTACPGWRDAPPVEPEPEPVVPPAVDGREVAETLAKLWKEHADA